jgi:hypothetical protein
MFMEEITFLIGKMRLEWAGSGQNFRILIPNTAGKLILIGGL